MTFKPGTAGHLIGIDVGGTGIKGGIVNVASGTLAGPSIRMETPRPATPSAVAAVVSILVAALEDMPGCPRSSQPVGITFPGIVQNGIARSAANVDSSWIGVDAAAVFSAGLQRDVVVLNDADAAGLAEATCGAGRGIPGTVLVITLGTGIGSALVFDGKLVPNAELGHLAIDGFAAEIAASAVARERDGITWAEYSVRLQRYFSHLEFIFSPELFVVGGGISACTDLYLPLLNLRSPIVAARLQNEAGIIGAALAAGEPAPAPPLPASLLPT